MVCTCLCHKCLVSQCVVFYYHHPLSHIFVCLNNNYPNYWFLYHTLLMVSIIIHYYSIIPICGFNRWWKPQLQGSTSGAQRPGARCGGLRRGRSMESMAGEQTLAAPVKWRRHMGMPQAMGHRVIELVH